MNRWFVGSGGGSKGSPFHAGFLKARAEQGIEYTGAAGVSAGGLAALAVALNPSLAEAAVYLEDLALTVTTPDIHKRRFFGKLAGLWSSSYRTAEPFQEYIQEAFKGKTLHKQLRLGITAVTDDRMPDTEEGAPGATAYFTVDETFEPLWRAGYATSAFPGVFEPMKIDGRWCLDGGIQVVTPIAAAIEAGATHIDCVVADTPWPSFKPTEKSPGNTVEVLLRSLELAVHRNTWTDVRYTQAINALVESGHVLGEGKRYVELNVVHPTSTLNSDSMDFVPKEAAEIALRGYNLGRALT